ncbi:Ku protein [Ectothiorhodospiraceae bacterium 2226]|nr:Ku protein [Ectothiorhodospiraceae bacterium 2226]
MSRVIWKGSISFGLVYVPVGLYSSERRSELSLSLLDRRDMAPVGYRRYNKSTGEDIEWGEVVKGYEFEPGQFVVLDEEDFTKANVKATQTVEIQDFVPAADIPMIYYDKPYYLEPLPRGEKGYVLLRETLKRTKRVGIAKVVLRSREHLAALVPWNDVLVLNLLRFHHELREPSELKLPTGAIEDYGVADREIDMAERLVEGMSTEWEPQRYRDEYREDLLRLIEEKAVAGEAHAMHEPEAPARGAEVIDIMEALKRSVEATKKGRGAAATKSGEKKGRARGPTRKRTTRGGGKKSA